MKKSIILRPGIYQYEFFKDQIAVAQWDQPPKSSNQWVKISPDYSGTNRFRIQGTNLNDLCVVPVSREELQEAIKTQELWRQPWVPQT